MKKFGRIIIASVIVFGASILPTIIAYCIILNLLIFKMIADPSIIKPGLDEQFFSQITQNSEFALFLSMIGSFVWILLFGWLYISKRKKLGKTFFPLKLIPIKRGITLLVLGFGLSLLFGSILLLLVQIAPDWMKSQQQIINDNDVDIGNTVLSFLYIVLIAPIGEELLFRGFIFDYLKEHINFLTINIFQAFLFGLCYMNLLYGVYSFFLGLIYGWLLEHYGSIKESILLNIAFSLTLYQHSIFLNPLLGSSLSIGISFLLSICIVVFSIRMMKHKV